MRDDRRRLTDILEAIDRIEKYAVKGEEEFRQNELVQIWILHHIQIIGEAASKLSSPLQESQPEVPWAQIIGIRNLVVHEYFGLDFEEVWNTVVKDLPPLRAQLSAIADRPEDFDSPG